MSRCSVRPYSYCSAVDLYIRPALEHFEYDAFLVKLVGERCVFLAYRDDRGKFWLFDPIHDVCYNSSGKRLLFVQQIPT